MVPYVPSKVGFVCHLGTGLLSCALVLDCSPTKDGGDGLELGSRNRSIHLDFKQNANGKLFRRRFPQLFAKK
jgi:hypothetical protein